jgi:hypothetical protein
LIPKGPLRLRFSGLPTYSWSIQAQSW